VFHNLPNRADSVLQSVYVQHFDFLKNRRRVEMIGNRGRLRSQKIKHYVACVTLGTKNKSALNLKSQSSKKWKRSDSKSSPETQQTK